MSSGDAWQRQTQWAAGFAYVWLLLGLALGTWGTATAWQSGAMAGRRDAEQALLVAGFELERALYSHVGVPWGEAGALTHPQAFSWRGPKELEDLLRDPRVAGVQRHLRRLVADPLTGQTQWGVVRDPAGHIVGVYSLSEGRPIRQAGFEPPHAHFAGASSYQQWVFGLPAAPLFARPKADGAAPPPP